MIKNNQDLARALGVVVEKRDRGTLKQSIRHEVYRSSESGVCIDFLEEDEGVVLSGYCEGVDATFKEHVLRYPFEEDVFWQRMEDADEESDQVWRETHGCPGCAQSRGETWEPGTTAIANECPQCGGEGIIV